MTVDGGVRGAPLREDDVPGGAAWRADAWRDARDADAVRSEAWRADGWRTDAGLGGAWRADAWPADAGLAEARRADVPPRHPRVSLLVAATGASASHRLTRAAPVLAAAAVALVLARLGGHHPWPPTAHGWAATWLDLTLAGGILATAALAVLRWIGRGGRRGAVAAVAVPLATGLTAAGLSSALAGLVLTGLALHWLGYEF